MPHDGIISETLVNANSVTVRGSFETLVNLNGMVDIQNASDSRYGTWEIKFEDTAGNFEGCGFLQVRHKCDGKAEYPLGRIVSIPPFSNLYLSSNYPKTYEELFSEANVRVTDASDPPETCSRDEYSFQILDYRYEGVRA